jgi:hypothetical protein
MGSSARIEATFGRDERLGLWLPVKMTERQEGRASRRLGTGVPVNGTATYGDFKRFETSSSIDFKE